MSDQPTTEPTTETTTETPTTSPTDSATDTTTATTREVRTEAALGATAVGTAPAPRPSGVRVGTVVWGLVLAALGVGLLAFVSGIDFDVELAVIALVAAAGLALLVGSVVTARRRG